MSNRICCVPGCSNNAGCKDVLHKFPNPAKDKNQFNTWVFSVGGDILGLSDDHIFKYRRVCHKHFEEKYLCRNNLLSNIAIPTQNMPGLSLPKFTFCERRPLRSIQNVLEPSTSKDPPTLYSVPAEKYCSNVEVQIKERYEPVPGSRILDEAALQATDTFAPVAAGTLDQQATDTDMKYCEIHKAEVTKILRKRKICTPLSQTEQALHKKLVRVGIKLSKCRSRVKKQAIKIKTMQNIVSRPQLSKAFDNWPRSAKLLTLLQFRERNKGMKGRRFTLEEKIMTLSIFKQSPKGYRFFRKIFILPSPQTLVKLLSMANIEPGINETIINQIRNSSKNMTIEDRLCILLFDEMSLKCNVTYNERKDEVSGFVTDGKKTRPEFADHAQVFLIRGLIKNYKQPIAYTFSQAATKGPELAVQLKAVITKLQEAGLIVVSTVCDQGTNNVQCIKLLMEETRATLIRRGEEQRENIFIVNDHEIIPLYDPPHLIKCVRNNLITKNLQYGSKIAKWSHIISLHKENPGYKGIRLVPKLTDFHCIPSKIPKQKVKYATQLFSQTVATNMGYLADKGILPSECKDTADLLLFFDRLFDSVNGSHGKRKKYGKPLLGSVTPSSDHHQLWHESKKMLANMNFIKADSGKADKVLTLKNWVWTLEGLELLINKMHTKYGIISIWLRHLNQDPIENFFGSIRSHGCRNTNPSPDHFESAYATLLVNSLSGVHAPGANCEIDNCFMLSNIIITDSNLKCIKTFELEDIPDVILTPLEKKSDPREIGGLLYVCGYFVKNAKKKIFKGCVQCKKDLISQDEPEYLKYREYTNKKWLCSPTQSVLSCVSSLQDINYLIIKDHLEKNHLSEFIKTIILMFIDFDFINCKIHKYEIINFLIKISCRFFIHNYCKEINKILSNKRQCDDNDDLFKTKAKKYFFKSFKRKNK